MASPQEQEAFIKKAAPGAQRGFKEFGVPASVTIAQAIQESAWGTQPAGKANNYFGIKAPRVGNKFNFGTIAIGAVDLRTGEDTAHGTITITAPFRKYRTMADSFRDHGKFLRENSRYKPCFQFKHDPNEFARQLQKAGYATDRHYADSLIALMKGHNLYRFDKGVHAGGAAKPTPTPKPKTEAKPKHKPKPKPKPAAARAQLFVAGLQRDLNAQLAELGSSRRLAVDGRWDPDTAQAFEQICRIHGIEPERSVRTFRLIAGLTETRTPEELARAAKEGARFAQRLTRRFATTRGVGVATVGGKDLPDKERGAAFIAALQRDLNAHLRRLGSPRVLAVDGVWDPHTDRAFHQITAILGLPPKRETNTFRLIGAAAVAPRTLTGIARPTKAGAELEARLKTTFASARTAGPTVVVGGHSLPGKELAKAYIAGLQRDLNTQLKWLGATQRLKVDGAWDPATNRAFRRVCTVLGIEPTRNAHTFRKIAGATAQRTAEELARAAQDGAAFEKQLRSFFALEPAVVVTHAKHPGAAHDNGSKAKDKTQDKAKTNGKAKHGARTFRVREPAMKGDDVLAFQRVLNERLKRWKINLQVIEDRAYGTETRKAARRVAFALGIAAEDYAHGFTPELRAKIRDPRLRTHAEIERAKRPRVIAFRSKLRRRAGKLGNVVIAPGANLAGQPVTQLTLDYVAHMAALLGKPIVVTTGTNHSKFTNTGNISDHFSGHAVDIGMIANGGTDDSPVGDAIMTCALRMAGVGIADAKAKAHAGGLFNFVHDGKRIQCIWKTNIGGNHHNHVHVGVRPA